MKRILFVLCSSLALTACWLPIRGPETVLPHRSNDLGMEFVQLPAGRFFMGNPRYKLPQTQAEKDLFGYASLWPIGHQVILTQPFWLQSTEVTQAQWRQVMGEEDRSQEQYWLDFLEAHQRPAFFQGLSRWRWLVMRTSFADDYPVFNITWQNAQRFLARLNALNEGHYRLPTEAEWEYAARAGGLVRDLSDEMEHADSAGSAPASPGKVKLSPTRSSPPNPWGLYDLYGGVSEMLSHAIEPYDKALRIDPQGPNPQDVNAVGLRGANFYSQGIDALPNLPLFLDARGSKILCHPQQANYLYCMKSADQAEDFALGLRLVWEPGS